MHSVLFELGPVHVYGYGFMIALGVISAFWIACFLAKRSGLDSDEMFNMGLVGIIGGIIGAKLLYYIVELPSVIENPSVLLNLGEGFVVYGGLIAGLLCPLIYTRRKKISLRPYLDCAVPGVAFAQGLGRIGCFLAGCCYGAHTDAWFGVVFPESSLAPAGEKLIPTQLISAAGDFIFAIILFFLQRRLFHRPQNQRHCGAVAGVYLILYSVGRFFVEFLRDDPRGNVGSLSTSQFIAVFMLAAGAAVLTVCLRDGRTPGKE